MKSYPIILAIDTSCDETSVALTQGMRVLSNVVASQVEIHRKYGGVMPLEAKLAHHELINPTYQEALTRAMVLPKEVDAIAVTVGPGLAIALEVGIDFAKTLSQELHKPLIAVNHMAGHLFSVLAVNSKGKPKPEISLPLNPHLYPILGLLVSGKHTEIAGVNFNDQSFSLIPIATKLGQTVDDAAGECLDKFARMLDLGYPGAYVMEQLAREGDPKRFDFPLPMTQSHNLNYSFSGLKTAGRHLIGRLTVKQEDTESTQSQKGQQLNHLTIESSNLLITNYQLQATLIQDLAASFQRAVFKAILYKLKKAIDQYLPRELWMGGGVIANLEFRKQLRQVAKQYDLKLRLPYSRRLMGDNAAMIGVAAYFQYSQQDFVSNLDNLHRQPRLSL